MEQNPKIEHYFITEIKKKRIIIICCITQELKAYGPLRCLTSLFGLLWVLLNLKVFVIPSISGIQCRPAVNVDLFFTAYIIQVNQNGHNI